ncbi:TBC1 domain family member 8 [Sciurus carolinensis]|uniref:TBC1 domain family member 8 n=1 Tax=Sciurus carolinensis TaxID=30640 RepID=A0AA41MQH1_SCICA|nr:TBC1 domain family member 8 [Sciurus carolinensis]
MLPSHVGVAAAHWLRVCPSLSSQVYSPIACGEFLDGCDVHWAIATGATLEEINQYWNWLGQNLLHTVFDYKDDMASFVKGKVKLLWTPFSRFHTAGRMFSSDSSTCFASREDDCYNIVLLLREVVSIEKMEDTSLLPSPILISIRSKMAFQFIELKDRQTLVETLLERLKQVHANHPMHYDTSTNDKDMAGHTSPVLYLTSMCSEHKFGDLEMASCHSSKEREDKSPPLHPGPLTIILQPLGSQNPDSHLVGEVTPFLVCHDHWSLGNDHGECGT